MTAAERAREAVSRWRGDAATAWRHPWRAPGDPPYRRLGVAYFFVVGIAALAALVWLAFAGDGPLLVDFLVPFTIVAIVTGFTEIRIVPERQTILNDLFFIVPFVFFPLEASALLILVVGLSDPVLHPRSATRAMARISSIVPMRMASLAAVEVARVVVPEERWWSLAAIAVGGLVGQRISDYFLFPISLRLGIGPDFSYGEYLREAIGEDVLVLGIEMPLVAIAATAYPHAPWLVLGLAIPYFAAWRLALLRPAIDSLRQADELKSGFLSMASHELRTPLTAISGFATTLAHRWDDIEDGERRRFLGVIEEQSARLSRMIDQLLTMSRIEAGALETSVAPVRLSPLLERASLAAGLGPDAVSCDAALSVSADPDHLEQIVVNFVGNAVKYGAPPITIVASGGTTHAEVRVIDHGPGVPEWFRPRMYEQFAQASSGDTRLARGTGLGLSIVDRLAAAMGAEVDYEPVEPHGACFIVRLPLAASADDT